MPVHPAEENAPSGITEKLAKDPSSKTESTASEHAGHANEHNPLGADSGKATQQDFVGKGPQIVEDMPMKASKEEVKARMEELNK